MEEDDIQLGDLYRIFIGEAPIGFLWEVLLRTILVFVTCIVALRLLGKRMSGQLTITEMAVMIMLGAMVSPPAQIPERGILLGILLLGSAVGLHRMISFWGYRNKRVEQITQGHTSLLVKEGVLQLRELTRVKLPHQQLFSELRSKDILNLGTLKRVYLEPGGDFSIFFNSGDKRAGLPIIPQHDKEMLARVSFAENHMACTHCGNTEPDSLNAIPCSVCQYTSWTKAIY